MSSAKWELVNGMKFPVEENNGSLGDLEETEVSEGTFVYEGSVWDVVREITPEEAAEFLQEKTSEDSKHYHEMTNDELRIMAFGEGIPPGFDAPEIEQPIVVSISSDEFQMPFGIVKTLPFTELFWRNTGADCPDEQEEMKFPDGKTYKIKLSV